MENSGEAEDTTDDLKELQEEIEAQILMADSDDEDTADNNGNAKSSSPSNDPEDAEMKDESAEKDNIPGPVRVLPLYSLLPAQDQLRIFQPVPEGTRYGLHFTPVLY